MKKVVGVLAVALVVLLVLMSALAWFFSGLVLDGAEIKGADPTETEVVSVEPDPTGDTGTLVYRVADDLEDPATDRNTVTRGGMFFADGGYLQLDQDAVVDGTEITRSYTLLAGEAPEPGDLGTWDWASYPDATVMGLEQRDVTYDAPLGPTPAIIVEPAASAPPSDTWAIGIHGRNSTVREPLRVVPRLAERGITSMLINYRDDRKEPDVPAEDGLANFGVTEWPDVEAAVEYARANGADDILLVGYSQGGAVVAGYLERGGNTEVVSGTILDSPMVSFHDTTVFGAELRGYPTDLLTPVIWLAERFVELRSDIDYSGSEYVDNAPEWPVPALVTAATEDDLVPPESIEEFAAALPDGTFELFQGAFHTQEWNQDWVAYDALVTEWLDEYYPVGQ